MLHKKSTVHVLCFFVLRRPKHIQGEGRGGERGLVGMLKESSG